MDKWDKRLAKRWSQLRRRKSLEAMGLTVEDAIAIERKLLFNESATLSNGERI